ncbi:MAG TPA: hypothetical protein VM430_08215 [Microbacterium sp.]|nr:hypothetical protein [Microbacterium sp.]
MSIEKRISGELALVLAEHEPVDVDGEKVVGDTDTYCGEEDGETVLYVDRGGQRYEVRVLVARADDVVTAADRARDQRVEALLAGKTAPRHTEEP